MMEAMVIGAFVVLFAYSVTRLIAAERQVREVESATLQRLREVRLRLQERQSNQQQRGSKHEH